MYYLYIIRNRANRLYIGITNSLENRINYHNSGSGAKYTKINKSYMLVYSEEFQSLNLARKRENQLKKWSRAKKEALISKDIQRLKYLSSSFRQAENKSIK